MIPLDIKRDVKSFLDTNWTLFDIVGRNEVDDIDRTATHGVLNFNPGKSYSLEIQGAYDRPGVFIIQVFTRLGSGTDEGWDHCGGLEDLFRNNSIGDIFFQSGDVVPYSAHVGKDDELQMFQFNVVVPFSVITG